MTTEVRIGQVRKGNSAGAYWKVLSINGNYVTCECIKENWPHHLGEHQTFRIVNDSGAGFNTWKIIEQASSVPTKGFAAWHRKLKEAA